MSTWRKTVNIRQRETGIGEKGGWQGPPCAIKSEVLTQLLEMSEPLVLCRSESPNGAPSPGVQQGEAGTPGVLQLKKLSRKSQGTSPNYSPSGRGCKLSPHEQMLKQGIRHQWMQGWVVSWQFAVSQGHAQVRLSCTQSEWIQHEGINHLEVDPWGTRCARLFQRQHIQGRQYITVVQMNASSFQCSLALHITATHLSPLLWFLVTKQLSD